VQHSVRVQVLNGEVVAGIPSYNSKLKQRLVHFVA